MSKLKDFAKKIILKEKSSSAEYVKYLNSIGANIDSSVWFVAPTKTLIDITRPYMLEIGKNVVITEDVKILTHGFDWSVIKIKEGNILGSAGKITIGDNVFIGVGTIVLKGVSIGENTIIGAGSVITHDIPANSVAVGNPCNTIYTLSEYIEKRKKAQINEAFDLVESYINRYQKKPAPEELSEFFFLFEDKDIQSLNNSFLRKMNYGPSSSIQKCRDLFISREAPFKGYDSLINQCIKERNIILNDKKSG